MEKETDRNQEAFEAAIDYIAASPRSEKEVREKLYKKGFHRGEVESALLKVKDYGYVDDEKYVDTYLDFYAGKYGKNKIVYKLTYEKGVDKTLVQNAVADRLDEDAELEKAMKFAEKYVAAKKLEKKNSQKLWAFLVSKGFDRDVISRAVSKCFDTDFDD